MTTICHDTGIRSSIDERVVIIRDETLIDVRKLHIIPIEERGLFCFSRQKCRKGLIRVPPCGSEKRRCAKDPLTQHLFVHTRRSQCPYNLRFRFVWKGISPQCTHRIFETRPIDFCVTFHICGCRIDSIIYADLTDGSGGNFSHIRVLVPPLVVSRSHQKLRCGFLLCVGIPKKPCNSLALAHGNGTRCLLAATLPNFLKKRLHPLRLRLDRCHNRLTVLFPDAMLECSSLCCISGKRTVEASTEICLAHFSSWNMLLSHILKNPLIRSR